MQIPMEYEHFHLTMYTSGELRSYGLIRSNNISSKSTVRAVREVDLDLSDAPKVLKDLMKY